MARPGRSPSAWSPSRPASTSPPPTARRSRRRCSTTSTRPWSSMDQDGKIVPALARVVERVRGRQDLHLRPGRGREVHQRRPFTAEDAKFSIDRVQDGLDDLAQGGDGRRRRGEGRLADPAAGDAEQAEQRLAVPDDDPDRRDVRPRHGVDDARHRARSAPARTTSSKWNRGDSITLQPQRRLLGRRSRTSRPSRCKYFKDPTALNNALLTGTINVIGTVQAPESLHQFTGQQQVPGHRGHHQRRGRAVVQQRPRPADRPQGAPGDPLRRSTTRR